MQKQKTIADLNKNVRAKIIRFSTLDAKTETRLREIGFAEGDVVEVLRKGLFGKSPINIRVHGMSLAMRPAEARMIIVEVISQSQEEPSASDKIQVRLDAQRKLNESGSCCGGCGGD